MCKTEIESQRTNIWLPREEGGVGSIRRLGLTDIHTLLCIKWITNEKLLYSELYSILCDGLYGKRIQKRVDICIIDSLCFRVETNTL